MKKDKKNTDEKINLILLKKNWTNIKTKDNFIKKQRN